MRQFILGVAIAFISFVIGSSASSAWNFISIEESPEPATSRKPVIYHNSVQSSVNPVAEAEIHELYHQYAIAETNHDEDFFKRVEADNFISTSFYGHSINKDQAIAEMKTWDTDIKYSIEVLDIQLYGEVAFVKAQMTDTYSDGEIDSDLRWVDVLKKSNGQWQILSSTEID